MELNQNVKDENTEKLSWEEQHQQFSKVFGGYTAFVTALLFAMMAKGDSYPRAYIAITLFAVSLPSLVAVLLLDYKVRVVQNRKRSAARGLAFFLGIIPSITGIAVVIGHFSIVGAVLFVLVTLYWAIMMDRVTYLGGKYPGSDY